jgi:hypothetical protein
VKIAAQLLLSSLKKALESASESDSISSSATVIRYGST